MQFYDPDCNFDNHEWSTYITSKLFFTVHLSVLMPPKKKKEIKCSQVQLISAYTQNKEWDQRFDFHIRVVQRIKNKNDAREVWGVVSHFSYGLTIYSQQQ